MRNKTVVERVDNPRTKKKGGGGVRHNAHEWLRWRDQKYERTSSLTMTFFSLPALGWLHEFSTCHRKWNSSASPRIWIPDFNLPMHHPLPLSCLTFDISQRWRLVKIKDRSKIASWLSFVIFKITFLVIFVCDYSENIWQ